MNSDFLQRVSVQFSRSVVSDSLRPHELQHARPPCPSPTPGVYSNSSPLSQWCHPIILSSVVPFPTCPQSLPASGSFLMSQLFTLGGQSIGVSASTSIIRMNTQDWYPFRWTSWISRCPRESQESSPIPQFKSINSLALSFLYSPTLTTIHDYWTRLLDETTGHDYLMRRAFAGKLMSLFFNMLFWLVIAFLPKSKHLLISWLQSPPAVILEPPKK